MSEDEAHQYADLVIESLREWGYLSERDYGRMTEDHRHMLAERIVEKSEE